MYILFLITILIVSVRSANYSRDEVAEKYPGFGTKWIYMEGKYGNPIKGHLSVDGKALFDLPDPRKVSTFTLYTRNNKQKGIQIRLSKDLPHEYDKKKPTKFVTHGWMSSGDTPTCLTIKDGFLEKYDVNVIIMDWSEISQNLLYPAVAEYTPKVGKNYGVLLNKLVDSGADPSQFHLIGHSLGAHVSGFAAREVTRKKVGRVTGLDPAGPKFDPENLENRMNKNDAEFVDIIHTCSGFLGMKEPLGHADFYPNRGVPPQPGCGILEMIEACSHGASWRIFAKSLTTSIPAQQCKSLDHAISGNCEGSETYLGEPTSSSNRGIFYARTDQSYSLRSSNNNFNNLWFKKREVL